ncbi:hypothetical protein JQS43_04380 [Natronosporangium hydrolyticum]|uniref:Lipoprotein n=1 Tax=Natronosporangium hydrolyticum TaxID=2811111 RepID=A0A895YCP2_9ACTN|nr:hypothetical protein [Natronosporangium hydrolyticum]QSB15594.1 hypothetical protein JQS43_04380 [Natronosporangium hydrolyticum]
MSICWWRTLAALLLAALALAGCSSGEQPTNDATASPPSIPPPEERLHFEWDEAIEVPESARAAVAIARDWDYYYYLWITDPDSIPEYLKQHSTESRYESIAGISAPQTAGAIRILLVDLRAEDDQLVLHLCDDRRDRDRLDEYGQRVGDPGGITPAETRLEEIAPGRWLVSYRSLIIDTELRHDVQSRCEQLLTDPPTPDVSRPATGIPDPA